jgi:hypothetical protein
MAVPRRVWATTRRRVFKYRRQTFWAEDGLCHVVDENTGEYKAIAASEFLKRAQSFNQAAWRGRHDKQWIDERDELIRMVQDMLICIEQAKLQGDPFDPRAMRQMVSGGRPTRVSIPRTAAEADVPTLPISATRPGRAIEF